MGELGPQTPNLGPHTSCPQGTSACAAGCQAGLCAPRAMSLTGAETSPGPAPMPQTQICLLPLLVGMRLGATSLIIRYCWETCLSTSLKLSVEILRSLSDPQTHKVWQPWIYSGKQSDCCISKTVSVCRQKELVSIFCLFSNLPLSTHVFCENEVILGLENTTWLHNLLCMGCLFDTINYSHIHKGR